jgi:hypothetical protein
VPSANCDEAHRNRQQRTVSSGAVPTEQVRWAEKTQNITDISTNSIDIFTNTIDISTNLNDILSLFGTMNDCPVRRQRF